MGRKEERNALFTTFVVAFSVPGVFEGGKRDLDNKVVSIGGLSFGNIQVSASRLARPSSILMCH